MIGHAHMMFGALEDAVKGIPQWPCLEKCIRLFVKFFKEKGLRDRFVEVCCTTAPRDVKAKFRKWHVQDPG